MRLSYLAPLSGRGIVTSCARTRSEIVRRSDLVIVRVWGQEMQRVPARTAVALADAGDVGKDYPRRHAAPLLYQNRHSGCRQSGPSRGCELTVDSLWGQDCWLHFRPRSTGN